MDTETKPRAPIHCTPCRVCIDGAVYRIKSNGDVYRLHAIAPDHGRGVSYREEEFPLLYTEAQDVRREAARLRRNRNARERHRAHRDLGLTRTPAGWE